MGVAQRSRPARAILLLLLALSGCGESDEQQAADAFQKGMKHFVIGDFDKAVECYNETIRLNPKCAEAYNQRALCRWFRCELEQSVGDFANAIRVEPKAAVAYFYRACALQSMNYERALSDLNEAIKLNPKNALAHQMRATLQMEKNPEAAIADLSEVLHLAPDFGPAYAMRATAYRNKRLLDKAKADERKVKEILKGQESRGVPKK
jgi:tetratricopeptide (TPR) repeat protein